mgnify:CR=1 FL=1
MMYVILRNGKVLKYNDANHLDILNDEYTLRRKEGESSFLACFPMDVVERIEIMKPCKIMKEKRDRKRMLVKNLLLVIKKKD